MILVMTTVSNEDVGKAFAEKIVEARLATCVQVMPRMTSVYVWDGAIQKDEEHLLLIKTLEEKYDELEKFIRENHSYEIPEIVAVRSERAADGYLEWMTKYLR